MKKCKGCDQEIDKYAIACEYCGKIAEERVKSDAENPGEKDPKKKTEGPQED